MTKMFFTTIVTMVIMISCASASQKLDRTSVSENKLYYNDIPLAELRYLGRVSNDQGKILHRGLAIYYYHSNKEVWIYPENGWKVAGGDKDYYSIEEIDVVLRKRGFGGVLFNNRKVDKNEAIHAWCFDVRVSNDGKYVYYKTKGLIFESSQKYSIEYPPN
jgi:hypothetical protein